MQRQIRNLTLAAMLLALGLILPLVTGNICLLYTSDAADE